MDNLRGNFNSSGRDEEYCHDFGDDDAGVEAPPPSIGVDERRMQVRAYNHWAGQLGDKSLPSIDDLQPEKLTDFGPSSVLLDFSTGIDDPQIKYLGDMLADECGTEHKIKRLSDVPSRSLLSRITDHYLQIIANQAPIGFEAEFVNQRDATILYRGILLPYSSDGENIDFIYGVINWKELADQETADELMRQIDQALKSNQEEQDAKRTNAEAGEEWADGPGAEISETELPANFPSGDDITIPMQEAGANDGSPDDWDDIIADEIKAKSASVARLSALIRTREPARRGDVDNTSSSAAERNVPNIADSIAPLRSKTSRQNALQEADIHNHLAEARELALVASDAEDRSRTALYAAISRAHDVALAAQDSPDEFAQLMEDNSLEVQKRAPLTPVVKLVFGANYNKTRIAEYASVLAFAKRKNIGFGELEAAIGARKGGIKAIVESERRLRGNKGKAAAKPQGKVQATLARKLRKLDTQPVSAIEGKGPEFGLVMIRRLESGEITVVGEISSDVTMVEKAGRKLLG